ncbi:hypothetical protein [Dysgonomonas sp. ZJ279]|uniref:hypothetical protein n=1 Tax=Dysgonomonas sp. ZJ279 TaxID=2709796 RepID=UPI0013EDB7E6|nr:hypothetical protein [Dysgonomonas sp. ZJ279]
MIQQREKDYLQRIIEEFFAKLQEMDNNTEGLSLPERRIILEDCYKFFADNFEVTKIDTVEQLAEKIDSVELFEQYAKLLLNEYEITDNKDKALLLKAFSIVETLENTDTTYSWERTVLREDVLRLLEEKADQ